MAESVVLLIFVIFSKSASFRQIAIPGRVIRPSLVSDYFFYVKCQALNIIQMFELIQLFQSNSYRFAQE